MQKENFEIVQIIGTKNAITHNFGLKVYDVLFPLLQSGVSVNLSFKGIKNVSSGFCNASIGKLFAEIPSTKELLSFTDISNSIWQDKISEAIALVSNPDLLTINDSAISELFK